MKQTFDAKLRLSSKNIEILQRINAILEEYRKQGYKLTLRQLYYQLVSRDVIPNKDSEYKKLSGILTKGRMAGVVDWTAIEDRLRVPYLPYYVNDVEEALKDTIDHYRRDRQEGQDVMIELWVEKDALSSVLKRITQKYHIRLMVNRGYSSTTAMHDAYERFSQHVDRFDDRGLDHLEAEEKVPTKSKVVVLYLGDHDPSGIDMVRDIRDRMLTFFHGEAVDNGELPDDDDWYKDAFKENYFDEVFKINRIGLTMNQIKRFNPPPNPVKLKDTRSEWYVKRYGETCWEVDALNPQTLHEVVEDGIYEVMDDEQFKRIAQEEEEDKEELRRMMEKMRGTKE